MTFDEFKSLIEFENLPHFDGSDANAAIPLMPPAHELLSALSVKEAHQWILEQAIPKYVVQFHAANDDDVRYEVLFWLPQHLTAV